MPLQNAADCWFCVVDGVGKTQILRHWLQSCAGIYSQAIKAQAPQQIQLNLPAPPFQVKKYLIRLPVRVINPWQGLSCRTDLRVTEAVGLEKELEE